MLSLSRVSAIRYLFSQAPYKASIEAIKKLRAETSSPIGECKKALDESLGDHEKALAWLRNKGMITAEKKADKDTREGVVAAIVNPERTAGVLLEVNCETDFVAKNESFLNFVDLLLQRFITSPKNWDLHNITNEAENQAAIDKVLAEETPVDLFKDPSIKNLYDEKKLLVSKLQENIRIRRMMSLRSDNGRIGLYVHQAYQTSKFSGIGLQSCLMEFLHTKDSPFEAEQCQTYSEFCDNIATQYLGYPPKYLTESEIPEEVVREQTEKVMTGLKDALAKAPAHTHENMIKGKLKSTLYNQSVFKHMAYVLASDSKQNVGDYWKQTEKQIGATINLGRVEKWKCK